jgi:glycosyltransferase involved in cell wall biosynthesis
MMYAMMLALVCLGVAFLMEFALVGIVATRARRVIAVATILLLITSGVALIAFDRAVWTVIIDIFTIYRCINLWRLVSDRRKGDYLKHVSARSSLWLSCFQIALLITVYGLSRITHDVHELWYIALCIQLVTSLAILMTTIRQIQKTTPAEITSRYADRDLPTLSVLIPARNETEDLEACLQSLLASSYPKLEIIVLDDCSQNSRTPEIIRGFAHDGVRFIAGSVPPQQWLAKNYAYQQLADEANGELLMFCGVDMRFSEESLRALVETVLIRKKTMLSIVPRNRLARATHTSALLIQPFRYAWELALPRRLFHRPAVLSSCWVISRSGLAAAGQFKAVSRSVSPERYLARFSANHDDGYSFLRSNEQIAATSTKNVAEQRETAIRTRYPGLHRRIELAALVSLAECSILILPYAAVIIGVAAHNWTDVFLAVCSCIFLTVSYVRIIAVTYHRFLWRSLLLEPCAAAVDLGLLNYSLWKYEFSEVLWKGRNICIPVMRTIPRLPRLPD